jgi:hypothetical protein
MEQQVKLEQQTIKPIKQWSDKEQQGNRTIRTAEQQV